MLMLRFYFTFVRALAIFSLINSDAVSCEAGVVANKLDIVSASPHTRAHTINQYIQLLNDKIKQLFVEIVLSAGNYGCAKCKTNLVLISVLVGIDNLLIHNDFSFALLATQIQMSTKSVWQKAVRSECRYIVKYMVVGTTASTLRTNDIQ